MSTQKRFYTLSGNELLVEPWVQKINAANNVFQTNTYEDLVGASSHPFFYWHQIPPRLLKEDPGFKILLRRNVEKEKLLPWVLNANQYCFCPQKQDENPKRMLLITHHSVTFPDWEKLRFLFQGVELSWTCYAVSRRPNWPEEAYTNMYDYLFHEDLKIDSFYDINYWQNDTLSPLHIHLLQNGVSCRNIVPVKDLFKLFRSLRYGGLYFNINPLKI